MDKIDVLSELRNRLEVIRKLTKDLEEDIDINSTEAMLLEDNENVRTYRELIKKEDVQNYMAYHRQIGKDKRVISRYADEELKIEALIKQNTCKHKFVLLTNVDNDSNLVLDNKYIFYCLNCRKKLTGGLETYPNVFKDPLINEGVDYSLSEERINEILDEYEYNFKRCNNNSFKAMDKLCRTLKKDN